MTSIIVDPVMCVIFPPGHELRYYEPIGVDLVYAFNEEAGFEKNSVPGKRHLGVPKFILCGKDVPALFVTTPKLSTA